jgi:hypothetical protein
MTTGTCSAGISGYCDVHAWCPLEAPDAAPIAVDNVDQVSIVQCGAHSSSLVHAVCACIMRHRRLHPSSPSLPTIHNTTLYYTTPFLLSVDDVCAGGRAIPYLQLPCGTCARVCICMCMNACVSVHVILLSSYARFPLHSRIPRAGPPSASPMESTCSDWAISSRHLVGSGMCVCVCMCLHINICTCKCIHICVCFCMHRLHMGGHAKQ